jgi:hypothetical protein
VVDYRALYFRIEDESVPLPDIHSAFHWFSKANYFTTLDLNQACHQIPLSETSKHVTAFCTYWNLYCKELILVKKLFIKNVKTLKDCREWIIAVIREYV